MDTALPPVPPLDAALSGADYDLYVLAAYALAGLVMLSLVITGYRRRAKARARLERVS